MKELVMTVGLPRSGKTTWAKAQGCPIVNPDAIRLALHGQRYVGLAEPFVWAIATVMVRALFLAGHWRVVLDATSITQKRRDAWESDAWARVYHVIDTPADVCRERALLAEDHEIIPVIDRMAATAEWPKK